MKYGQLLPFSCIVGFSKPLYIGLMQRALLTFPYFTELKKAVIFSARNNARRVRSLLSGGMNYQPLLKDGHALMRLSSSVDVRLDGPSDMMLPSERLCADRARLLRDDMRSTIGELSGATLLDIGCNVGFFCHFFSSLGMRTVGIDNSQHNRHLRLSLSNSVRTARHMNRRYGLSCKFIEEDARKWMKHQTELFDVTLLLSVLHHFFLGYPMGEYEHDPMVEAKRFIEDITRMTRKVLYLEYEDGESSVSVDELMDFLRSQKLFRNVNIIGHSDDLNRPMIRCTKL
jgi:SAM-dependent methyltransferase